jgi:hypothetical protein
MLNKKITVKKKLIDSMVKLKKEEANISHKKELKLEIKRMKTKPETKTK